MSAHLFAWTSDDEYYFVEVEDEPDADAAGRRLASQDGVALVYRGRRKIRTQDCECWDAPLEACAEETGKPCVVRYDVDCWGFESFDTGDAAYLKEQLEDARADAARAARPFRVYLPRGVADPFADAYDGPQPIPVAPGQIEAGL